MKDDRHLWHVVVLFRMVELTVSLPSLICFSCQKTPRRAPTSPSSRVVVVTTSSELFSSLLIM